MHFKFLNAGKLATYATQEKQTSSTIFWDKKVTIMFIYYTTAQLIVEDALQCSEAF